jgi:ABC-type microcin C transport system permease subunit YejE
MVEVKFKFLHNISHYCNNIFSFHMHMFIIVVLHLNKLNTTIHSNMRLMVIAYNQNMYFKIHCKNSRNNITIHFIIIWHYKKFTQTNERRIHCRCLCFSVLLKSWFQLTTQSHVLLKEIPIQHLKFVLYQNRFYGFLPLVPLAPPTFL